MRRGREAAATHSPFILNITPFFDIVKGNFEKDGYSEHNRKKTLQNNPAAEALQVEKLREIVTAGSSPLRARTHGLVKTAAHPSAALIKDVDYERTY